MAGVGPRELDVAWLIYAHRGFEDIAHAMGLAGHAGLPAPADVVAHYEAATGRRPRDLDFYETYAAMQFAIVYLRVNGARRRTSASARCPRTPTSCCTTASR